MIGERLQTKLLCFISYLVVLCLSFGSVLSVYLHPIETNTGLWTGSTHFINCFNNNTEHKGVIKWFNENGDQIEEHSVSPYTTNSDDGVKLFFNEAKKTDSGQYKCVLEVNDEVVSSATVNVHIYKSMERIGAKDMDSAPEGETLSLNCIVRFDKSGTDSQITWMFNRTKLSVDSSGKLAIDEIRAESDNGLLKIRNTLTIRNLSRINEGNYTCIASTVNKHLSSIKYYRIPVRVEYGPYFASDINKYIWVSENEDESMPITINIVCKVTSYPPVKSFKWQTGDGLAMEAGKFRGKYNTTTSENKSILTVKYANMSEIKANFKTNFNNANLNKFRCNVVKQGIHNSTTFELKIGQSPIAPIIANYCYDSGILKLQLNETEQQPAIDSYHLIISKNNHIYFNASNKTINDTYELLVEIPSGEHQMEIYAHNPIGWSQQPVGLSLAVVSNAFMIKLDILVYLFVAASTTVFHKYFSLIGF